MDNYISNEKITFIDTFYDEKNINKYIIAGNDGFIEKFIYKSNRPFIRYNDYDNNIINDIIINYNDDPIKLINSGDKGYVNIWDFHSGILLKTIKVKLDMLGLSLWTYNMLLYADSNRSIILALNIESGRSFDFYSGFGFTTKLKVIYIPDYGKYLIFQNDRGFIYIWKTYSSNEKIFI